MRCRLYRTVTIKGRADLGKRNIGYITLIIQSKEVKHELMIAVHLACKRQQIDGIAVLIGAHKLISFSGACDDLLCLNVNDLCADFYACRDCFGELRGDVDVRHDHAAVRLARKLRVSAACYYIKAISCCGQRSDNSLDLFLVDDLNVEVCVDAALCSYLERNTLVVQNITGRSTRLYQIVVTGLDPDGGACSCNDYGSCVCAIAVGLKRYDLTFHVADLECSSVQSLTIGRYLLKNDLNEVLRSRNDFDVRKRNDRETAVVSLTAAGNDVLTYDGTIDCVCGHIRAGCQDAGRHIGSIAEVTTVDAVCCGRVIYVVKDVCSIEEGILAVANYSTIFEFIRHLLANGVIRNALQVQVDDQRLCRGSTLHRNAAVIYVFRLNAFDEKLVAEVIILCSGHIDNVCGAGSKCDHTDIVLIAARKLIDRALHSGKSARQSFQIKEFIIQVDKVFILIFIEDLIGILLKIAVCDSAVYLRLAADLLNVVLSSEDHTGRRDLRSDREQISCIGILCDIMIHSLVRTEIRSR